MSQINLLLIRHGEASESWGDHPDPVLSKNGEAQANSLIFKNELESLEDFQFISSPKSRAKLTAQPLVDKFQKHLNINSIYSEIPSSDIDKSDKKNWLRDIMQLDMDYLPEEVLKWKNNLVDDCLNLSRDTIIFTHFMVINALVSSMLKHSKIMYFYPDYVSITKITLTNNEIKNIVLGDEKKTIINL